MKNYIEPEASIFKTASLEVPVTIYGNAIIKNGVKIGRFSFINSGTELSSNTTIGRFCSIGKNCEIGVFDHPIDWLSSSPFQYNMLLHFPSVIKNYPDFKQIKPNRPKQTIIGHDVWIASKVIIKRGVTIGTGAIVAAGAVVIKDIPPYAVVGGIPAKILKYRFSEDIIERLLRSKWWERDISELSELDYDNINEVLIQLETPTFYNIASIKLKNRKLDEMLKNTDRLLSSIELSLNEVSDIEISNQKVNINMIEPADAVLDYIANMLYETDLDSNTINEILSSQINLNYDLDDEYDKYQLDSKLIDITNQLFVTDIVDDQLIKKINKLLSSIR